MKTHSLLALAFSLAAVPLFAEDASVIGPSFELVDPEMASAHIKPQVMRGYRIMMQTHKYLPDNANDRISCSNCHFAAGNSLGGRNAGISLVGVSQKYPIHLTDNKLYTLPERINSCFEKSLNGKALPINSTSMKDLLAYLNWISTPVTRLPEPAPTPWLGLSKKIRIDHTMNPEAGAQLFAVHCALCHGADGQGQTREEDLSYPPLWGPHSFNDAAGMNQLPILASFIFENMPYKDPGLSMEQALDIAAFIISRPRPHFQ